MMLTVATVGVYTPAMPPNDAMDVVFVDVKGVAHIGRRDNYGTWIAMGVGDDDNSPFSWNAATQTLNVPREPTLVQNGNGSYTFTPGDGSWAQKYFDHDEVSYWFALPKVEVPRAAK